MPPPSEGPVGPGDPTTETYHRGRSSIVRIGTLVAILVALAWAVRRRPSRVEIRGGSMAPSLAPGDWALAVPLRHPRRGDVVIVEHPGRPGYEMVKRLTALPGDVVGERVLGADEWWVEGDLAAASTDSRHFGPLTRDELKAKIVLIYWPKERRRRV